MSERAALKKALEAAPTVRGLAREAGVSPRLLTRIRDGERRMTRETRDRLLRVVRERQARYRDAAAALRSAEPDPRSG